MKYGIGSAAHHANFGYIAIILTDTVLLELGLGINEIRTHDKNDGFTWSRVNFLNIGLKITLGVFMFEQFLLNSFIAMANLDGERFYE